MTSKKSPCLRLLAERSVSVLAALVLATGAARGEVPVTTDVVNAQDGEAGLCAGAEAVRRPRPLTSPTADELASGRRLFAAQCTRCHGQDGAGGSGPSLRVPRLRRAEDDAALVGVIMDGVPGTAMAAAWQLSDPEVVLVAAYVRSLGRTGAEVSGARDVPRRGEPGVLQHVRPGLLDLHGQRTRDRTWRRDALRASHIRRFLFSCTRQASGQRRSPARPGTSAPIGVRR
jgi:mono/diheme cytochrome c family protein